MTSKYIKPKIRTLKDITEIANKIICGSIINS